MPRISIAMAPDAKVCHSGALDLEAMKALLFLAITAGCCGMGIAADSPAPPDSARTVPRALEYLVQNGKEWMDERNCASCHHTPMMIWAMREAKAGGFAIDAKALASALEWTLSPKVQGTTFPEGRKGDRDIVSMAAAFTALAVAGDDSVPADWWKKMRGEALHYQQAEGGWPTQTVGRPPILAPANAYLTLLMANALAVYAPKEADPDAVAARDKALKWLSAQPAEESTQFHALRLLLDTKLGLGHAPEEVKQSLEWLRGKQRNDGGWGQQPQDESDAHATGQAMYAMMISGIATDDPAIRRGRDFLTKTQAADGSWPMISRPTATSKTGAGNLEPITYSAAGWATMALSRAQGKK
jgi:hypothetical protein